MASRQDTAAAARLQALADSAEPGVRRQVQQALSSLRDSVPLSQVERALRTDPLAVENLAASLPTRLRPAVRQLERLYVTAVRTGLAAVPGRVVEGAPLTPIRFDATSPHMIARARQSAAQMVVEVTAQTKQAIRTVISRSFAEGITPRDTAQLLRPLIGLTERQSEAVLRRRFELLREGRALDQVDRMSRAYAEKLHRARAMLIARTETIRASADGTLDAWDQAAERGLLNRSLARKTWVVAYDDRLCPICRRLDGVKVPLDGRFQVRHGTVKAPPAHPACRCAVALVPGLPGQRMRAGVRYGPDDLRPIDRLVQAQKQAPGVRQMAVVGPNNKSHGIFIRGKTLRGGKVPLYDDTVRQLADTADHLGYDKRRINVVPNLKGSEVAGRKFTVAAQFEGFKGTQGKVSVSAKYLANAPPHDVAGVMAHEISHAKYRVAMSGRWQAYGGAENAKAFTDHIDANIAELRRQDGVSRYSADYWKQASGDHLTRLAVDETLAEIARIKETRRLGVSLRYGDTAVSPLWEETHRLLNSVRGYDMPKVVPVARAASPLAAEAPAPPWPVRDDVVRQRGRLFPQDLQRRYDPWTSGLSGEEAEALRSYTSGEFRSMNEALRGQASADAATTRRISLVDGALSRAPAPPPETLVWRAQRGAWPTEAAEGSVVRLTGFQSTSIDPEYAATLLNKKKDTFLEIKPKRGAFVRDISYSRTEFEFLLPHDAEYRVVGVKKVMLGESERTVIQLEMQ